MGCVVGFAVAGVVVDDVVDVGGGGMGLTVLLGRLGAALGVELGLALDVGIVAPVIGIGFAVGVCRGPDTGSTFGAGVDGGAISFGSGLGLGFIFVIRKENFTPALLGSHSMML